MMRWGAPIAGVVVAAAAWLVVGPAQLGGPVTYVVIHGDSMEPMLHEGDLALTRTAGSYEVGDVVAYHNRDLRQVVLHRVVGYEADRLVLQGDNNRGIDSYQPTDAEVVGALWSRVPGGGRYIEGLRRPETVTILVALGAFAGVLGRMGLRRRRHPGGSSSALGPGDILPSGSRTGSNKIRTVRVKKPAKAPVSSPDVAIASSPATPAPPAPEGPTAPSATPAPDPEAAHTDRPTAPRPWALTRSTRPSEPRADTDAPAAGSSDTTEAGSARARLSMAASVATVRRALVPASAAALAVAIALGGLAAWAFVQPAHEDGFRSITYRQQGRIEWGATVPPSAVYPDGEVDAGEPVFLQVVDAIDVTFAYQLDAPDFRDVTGEATLVAVLTDESGWTRTFELAPTEVVGDAAASLRGRLDLATIRGIVTEVEASTGLSRQSYQLLLQANVDVTAANAETEFTDHLTAEVPFQLDALVFRPAISEGEGSIDPLTTATTGRARVPSSVSNAVSVGPARLPISVLRFLALVGGAVALGYAATRIREFASTPRSEAERIAARHGRWIVTVSDATSDATVVDVSSFEGLARLAETHERLVLHERSEHGDAFVIRVGDLAYRYAPTEAQPTATPQPTAAPTPSPEAPAPVAEPAAAPRPAPAHEASVAPTVPTGHPQDPASTGRPHSLDGTGANPTPVSPFQAARPPIRPADTPGAGVAATRPDDSGDVAATR